MSRREKLLVALFLSCVASLALLKTADFDAWIHLVFGRLLWQTGSYPQLDPVTVSMQGEPFWYSSWLFGMLYYGAYQLFDTYGVVLLKTGSITLLFLILLKDSLTPRRNLVASLLVLMPVAVCIRNRFVERPDIVSFICIALSILLLRTYLRDRNGRYLYPLPFIHLLWANTHSSIGLMIVPFGAVAFGALFDHLLTSRGVLNVKGAAKPPFGPLGIAFAASLALSCVSPYGISQFTVSTQFLKDNYFKQEIVELLPPTFAVYWWFFLLLPLLFASFVLAWRRTSLIDLFLVAPFVVMGFSSSRFTYNFAIIAMPVIARNLAAALERWGERSVTGAGRQPAPLPGAVVAALCLWVAGFTAVSHANLFPFNYQLKPGFGFDLDQMPEKALAYMDSRGIYGKFFNTYEWGQYIQWRDFPKRVPFIDGRGYLSPDKLDMFDNVSNLKDIDSIAARYGVDAVIEKITRFDVPESLEGYGRNYYLSPQWALVYWDDVSILFLRRGGKYDRLIEQDEYRSVKPVNRLSAQELLRDPSLTEQILSELRRNVRQTSSVKGTLLLGQVLLVSGRYQEAIAVFAGVTDKNALAVAHGGLGQAWDGLGDYRTARSYYEKSLAGQETAEIHTKLATLYLKTGDPAQALKHLKRTISLDKKFIMAYPKLATAYQLAGDAENARKAANDYQSMLREAEAERFFREGVRAYAEQRYRDAENAYGRVLGHNPGHVTTLVNLGTVYYESGRTNEAYTAMKKALEIDPRNSLAHFGMARILIKRGDRSAASSHLKQYIELAPKGYYSRQARQELEKLE